MRLDTLSGWQSSAAAPGTHARRQTCSTSCSDACDAHRLSLGGPVIPDTKQPALYKIPLLPVGERVLLHLTCTIGACGALSIQPFVALPVSMAGLQLCHR